MKSSHLWILRQLISTCPFLGRIPWSSQVTVSLGYSLIPDILAHICQLDNVQHWCICVLCMYICMCVHIYINTHVCMCVCIYVYMYSLWTCSLNQKVASLCLSTFHEEFVFSAWRERGKSIMTSWKAGVYGRGYCGADRGRGRSTVKIELCFVSPELPCILEHS